MMRAKGKEPIARECDNCSRWTEKGSFLPSRNRNREGITECNNYVCDVCQREAENHRLVREALERHEKRPAA